MDTQVADFRPIRFSTDDLPEPDRIPAWRDFFGPSVFHTDIAPAMKAPFRADVTVRSLPGLCLVSQISSPVRLTRTSALLADGNDDLALFVSSSGGTLSQCGRELTFSAGDAVMLTTTDAVTALSPSSARFRCLHIRRAALAPLVTDLDDAILRPIPPTTEALRYLLDYIGFLQDDRTAASFELIRLASVHLRDLVALVLGSTHDATMVAQGRGLRAARLQTIKQYVVENLCQRGLSVVAVAAQHRLTPRYVQRLFETEGTTFSEFLLDQRLTRVYRMLADPRFAGRPVSALALDTGFGDVSYFNRCFRRRFGASPTHFRGVDGNH